MIKNFQFSILHLSIEIPKFFDFDKKNQNNYESSKH